MKRTISVGLSLAFICGLSAPTFATTENTNAAKLIDLSTSDYAIEKFNQTDVKEFSNCQLICLPDKSIEKVDKSKVKELVDNGTILYANKSEAIKNSDDLYEQIGVSPETEVLVNGAEVIGYFITNQNNHYVPGTESVLLLDDLDIKDLKTVPDVEELTKCIASSTLNHRKIIADKTNEDEVKTQLPSISYTKMVNNNTKIYGASLQKANIITGYQSGPTQFGSIYISQYMYEKCVFKENGVNKVLTDVVSSIDIDAAPEFCINKYEAVMHCNISNMEMIEGQYLETSANESKTFSASLSGGYSNGAVVSGSASAATNYNYTVNCQKITNNRETNKIYKWHCDPTKNWENATWHLEPGARIRNNNASSYKNQCYTAVQNFEICNLGLFGIAARNASYSSPFEVGAAW